MSGYVLGTMTQAIPSRATRPPLWSVYKREYCGRQSGRPIEDRFDDRAGLISGQILKPYFTLRIRYRHDLWSRFQSAKESSSMFRPDDARMVTSTINPPIDERVAAARTSIHAFVPDIEAKCICSICAELCVDSPPRTLSAPASLISASETLRHDAASKGVRPQPPGPEQPCAQCFFPRLVPPC